MKPWDSIRQPVNTPIGSGTFALANNCAIGVRLRDGGQTVDISVTSNVIDARSSLATANTCGMLYPEDLRDFAEFCIELAEQLEGGK